MLTNNISVAKIFCSFLVIVLCTISVGCTQACAGSWATQRPLAQPPCIAGQWVNANGFNPAICPANPPYFGVQSNTFTFAAAVSAFSIDFLGFDGLNHCARLQAKVNGVFYPLSASNFIDFPDPAACPIGSFNYVSLTPDGYIEVSDSGGPGKIGLGTIVVTNVNAQSVAVSKMMVMVPFFPIPIVASLLCRLS